jgi:4-hydroxythreonine-4-phosphate dehydrogenase
MSREGSKGGSKPIGITLGDPAGVGPEILVKVLVESQVRRWKEDFLIIGSEPPLQQAAHALGIHFDFEKVALPLTEKLPHIALIEPADIEFPQHLSPGRPGADSGWLSFKYLELGVKLAIEEKMLALVTLPVSKSLIARKVPGFRGHTEYLQEKAQALNVRMMLGTSDFRVILVTTHCPLNEVARDLTPKKISDTIMVTHNALKKELGHAPSIVVCALNPHAGDSGLLGNEESEIITPGVIDATNRGCHCAGPYPADVALAMTSHGEYDAAVAMYHDQALIALKLTCPNEGANITLGLPFVRTSPLHGTGFDIAGKGIAVENSLVDALKSAVKLAGGF